MRMVVVDEWHELLGNKRGVQMQLALARLRRWNPGLVRLGHVGDARQPARGDATCCSAARRRACWCRARCAKTLVIDTLLPGTRRALSLGRASGPRACCRRWSPRSTRSSTTLVFTNTRSQAEIWYQALLEARPDWAG